MKLALELCGTHGMPTWRAEPQHELWNITSDAITEDLARNLITQLSTGTENLVIGDLILSDDGEAAVIEIRSKTSTVHLREQAQHIQRIADEVLGQVGLKAPPRS